MSHWFLPAKDHCALFEATVGQAPVFDPHRHNLHVIQTVNIHASSCEVIYPLAEKDGGAEFALTIENAIEGGKVFEEMVRAECFAYANV